MSGPVLGPLAAVVVEADRWRGTAGWHVLYADLDLAERAATARTLGLGPEADDLALVRAALARWGPDAPAHLGGPFAVAAWDGDRQRVVAFRDGVGLRPLVYAARPGRLVVGGDIRAVLAAGVPDDLDEDVMTAVFLDVRFRPSSVGRTGFRAVVELRGGDRLAWDGRAAHVETWWDPFDVPDVPARGRDEIGEALRALLREVVAEHVVGGPVGVHLSAGIDSATVAAFAAEALPDAPPTAFSWQREPGDAPAPEHGRVRAAAERWGLPVVWCPPAADDFVAARQLDPLCDPTMMWAPEAPVRRAAAARGVRVVLSGWGGDEAASFSGRGLVSVELLRQGALAPVAAMIADDPVRALRRLRTLWARRHASRRQPSLEALRDAALAGEHPTFLRPDVLRRATLPTPEPAPATPRAHLAWLWRRGHLGLRASAWALAGAPYGLRYRYPLLDRRVLAFAMGLPLEAWLTHRGMRRWPLRSAGAGLVPDVVRLRPAKAEPDWIETLGRVQREAAAVRPPQLSVPRGSPYAALLDLDRLRAAWADRPAASPHRAPSADGLRALAYVARRRDL